MADSLHMQILDAFVTTLQGMGTVLNTATGNPAERVYKRMLLTETWKLDATFPCVAVAPTGTESESGGDNLQDLMRFPILVRVVDQTSEDNDEPLGDYLVWREAIRQKFHTKRLAGVPTVRQCLMQPSPVIEEAPLALGLISLPFSFEVETDQLRTTS